MFLEPIKSQNQTCNVILGSKDLEEFFLLIGKKLGTKEISNFSVTFPFPFVGAMTDL